MSAHQGRAVLRADHDRRPLAGPLPRGENECGTMESMSTRYFRRRWDDARADAWSAWGPSWWLFETDGEGKVLRQLEVYEDGPALRYSDEHPSDQYGARSSVTCLWELEDWGEFEIDRATFESLWQS